jgi:hypothetical protein
MKKILCISILLLVISTIAFSQVYWNRVEFRRVPNLTAYTIGDVVGPDTTSGASNLFALTGLAPSGGGYITGIRLTADTAVVATARFRIYWYADTVGNARPLDNAAFVRSMKEDSLIFAYTDLNLLSIAGTGSGTTTAAIDTTLSTPIPVRTVKLTTAKMSQTFFARIVAIAAYTPAFKGRFRLEVFVKPN